MNTLTLIGGILIALGVAGLIWGGVKYFDSRSELEIGDVEIVIQEREFPPELTAGAVSATIGVILFTFGAMSNRKR